MNEDLGVSVEVILCCEKCVLEEGEEEGEKGGGEKGANHGNTVVSQNPTPRPHSGASCGSARRSAFLPGAHTYSAHTARSSSRVAERPKPSAPDAPHGPLLPAGCEMHQSKTLARVVRGMARGSLGWR